ncbi:hypothetical protein GCM10023203_37750 [Actinomycetospora straminea]|uniref:Uncharacterized protein n=1 Tax=Actinomycetospora straminea TaxID=663607 RepID=A0ABP9EPH8_9PSEU
MALGERTTPWPGGQQVLDRRGMVPGARPHAEAMRAGARVLGPTGYQACTDRVAVSSNRGRQLEAPPGAGDSSAFREGGRVDLAEPHDAPRFGVVGRPTWSLAAWPPLEILRRRLGRRIRRG